MPTTSWVSTPRGMMRSDRLRAYACSASNALGFQSLYVAVVYRSCFRENLFLGHRGKQACLGDAHHPFLAQLRAVLTEVRHQLAKKL